MRLNAIPPSASPCENSWSTEGWFHSKKPKRLGQKLVERMVRSHTNLLLEARYDDWHTKVLPWDIEVIIEDPSDEEEAESDESDEDSN